MYNLAGGIRAWEGLTARGPVEMGMVHLRGDETPAEIILLAYGMEEGLGGFYRAVSESLEDQETRDLLLMLGRIEESHKDRLYDLYGTLDESRPERAAFEEQAQGDRMEGGFSSEEFLERNREALQSVPDVLNLAMMLETQALDLYLRYSQKSAAEGRPGDPLRNRGRRKGPPGRPGPAAGAKGLKPPADRRLRTCCACNGGNRARK